MTACPIRAAIESPHASQVLMRNQSKKRGSHASGPPRCAISRRLRYQQLGGTLKRMRLKGKRLLLVELDAPAILFTPRFRTWCN